MRFQPNIILPVLLFITNITMRTMLQVTVNHTRLIAQKRLSPSVMITNSPPPIAAAMRNLLARDCNDLRTGLQTPVDRGIFEEMQGEKAGLGKKQLP